MLAELCARCKAPMYRIMCVLLGALKAPRARVHRRLGRRHVTMRRGDGGVGVRQAVLGRYRRRALYVHGGSGRGRDAQGRFPLAGVFPSRIFSGSFFFCHPFRVVSTWYSHLRDQPNSAVIKVNFSAKYEPKHPILSTTTNNILLSKWFPISHKLLLYLRVTGLRN